MRPLLTSAQVAAILGVKRDFVLRRARQLGCVRIGKRDLRFDPETVEAWIVQRKAPGGGAVYSSAAPVSRSSFAAQLKERVLA